MLPKVTCIMKWIGGCKESGVKEFRIHDLRRSHAAHLIELGFSPVAIAGQLGHKREYQSAYMYAYTCIHQNSKELCRETIGR